MLAYLGSIFPEFNLRPTGPFNRSEVYKYIVKSFIFTVHETTLFEVHRIRSFCFSQMLNVTIREPVVHFCPLLMNLQHVHVGGIAAEFKAKTTWLLTNYVVIPSVTEAKVSLLLLIYCNLT